jgi:preprotein translocase subunit SecG
MTPLSGAADHAIAPWAYWHARSMVLAWGVLLPLGALLARFFKVRPGQNWPALTDDKLWWHGHQALQWSGVVLMTVGVWLAWGYGAGASAVARWHGWLGWGLCAAGWLQVVGALMRGSKGGPTDAQLRGDHYDMTTRRKFFEVLHKSLGWLALLFAVLVLLLGLVAADAPRWMLLVLGLWWLALGAAFAWLQARGQCIDTYQAIWGPLSAHPGNRIEPIGWGVRRPLG